MYQTTSTSQPMGLLIETRAAYLAELNRQRAEHLERINTIAARERSHLTKLALLLGVGGGPAGVWKALRENQELVHPILDVDGVLFRSDNGIEPGVAAYVPCPSHEGYHVGNARSDVDRAFLIGLLVEILQEQGCNGQCTAERLVRMGPEFEAQAGAPNGPVV